jgi:S-adenosylmethionine:tRNA ribosyltransferase-isomerase
MAFNYHLPDERIARFPLTERTDSRLMIVTPERLPLDKTRPEVPPPDLHQNLQHQQFAQLPNWLQPGDLLVMNNTRVIKARLHGQKLSGGRCELLIERVLSDTQALAMIKASKALQLHSDIQLGDQLARVTARDGQFYQLQLHAGSWWQLMESRGEMPLPPYLHRQSESSDEQRYQSVFAKHRGAVAAPTASLHFSEDLLTRLRAQGIQQNFLTLHVGAGTFLPLRDEQLQSGKLHQERVDVSAELIAQIEHTHAEGKRVIAVGTTVVRALEAAALSGTLKPLQGETDIFIREGFPFRVVDAMITNFHLPQSSLLMLVSAFAGTALMQHAYATAITHHYRFFSYGDAMFITHRAH